MNVLEEIMIKSGKEKIHMTLIDPASQSLKKSSSIAADAEKAGTDYFMIGGSTGITQSVMDECIIEIKKCTDTKVIIFPGSSSMISKYADAIYFMSLLNSTDPEFIVRHQMKASQFLRKFNLEIIPMGYLVFEPGMTVGKVGKVDLIGREDSDQALSYALAAQFFGMKLIYFEAGSGASSYVSPALVSAVRPNIDIPLLVGGGIRNAESAREIASSGADVIVTGTIAEKSDDVYGTLKPIIEAIKS